MRKAFWKLWVAGSLLVMVAATGCQQKPAEQAVAAPAATTPVKVAAYVCPMNCEGSASDKPGNCPVCDMKLEPNPAAQASAVPADSL